MSATRMIADVQAMAAQTETRTGRKAFAEQVMAVLAAVPRHEFVPVEQAAFAYENKPLPIGFGQTISQPYIVALMTDFLNLDIDCTVLEIGTGSGYQAAILGKLVKQVFSIEIVAELGEQAKTRLAKLHYDNVEIRISDGYHGWPEQAPFDAIIVTAAARDIPPPLIQQLKPNARMIIPIGERFQVQHLMLVEKAADGRINTQQILPVAFVPLTGSH